jgi:predicted metal-dependent peptidase
MGEAHLNPEEKLAAARAIVRKKWPYVMSTIYGMIPRRYSDCPTMFITKGMVLAYNPEYVNSIDRDELAAALVHESQHVLRGYFERVLLIDEQSRNLYMIAADMPINSDLKAAGWKTRHDWLYPETYKFPLGKSSEEYYEMLKKNPPPETKKLLVLLSSGSGKPRPGIGEGGCGAPSEQVERELDGQKDDDGKTIGRSSADKKAIIRQTIQETAQHISQKGRGSVPTWMQELVDLEHKPSRIPWQDRLQYVVRDMSGPIISGGDDYSMKHPSKRSFVRRIHRPGLVDSVITPLFIVDTSGSMSQKQMMAGIDESIAILTQLGIDEAYLCMVDAAVASPPKRISLADLMGSIEFKGRGGTDFGPGFRAAMKMYPRPDMIFYWTDGDGYAPRAPCPIPTIWGVVPNTHHTRRPARWGMVVTITDNEAHPDDDEENFQKPLLPPAGYPGYEDDAVDEIEEEEPEADDDELGLDDDD